MRFSKIFLNYLKGWLILDITACIPFQLIETIYGSSLGGSYSKLLRLARLPRLYKLVRIFRVFKFFKVLKTNPKIKQIIVFLK